jgi:gluconolactonase
LDPALDAIVASDAKLETLHEGTGVFEGPTWVHRGGPGYLIFSDIPGNVINKWTPDGKITVLLDHVFTGTDTSSAFQITVGSRKLPMVGPNGTTLDRQGRIVFCAFGDRQVVRLEKDGKRTILAERFEGKLLNNPNDLVYKSDGTLYFTDSAADLKRADSDPAKGVPHSGLYMIKGGQVQLLTKDFPGSNGLAFSPDQKYLYLNDYGKKIIERFDVQADDTIANGKLFIDMNGEKAPGAPDGMKVDRKGNVYCTGPGGLWILSPDGKHIGTILSPEPLTNLTFGDADAKTLYITGRPPLYRIKLKVAGIRP